MPSGADVTDQRRTETSKTFAASLADAPVDDAIAAGFEHELSELLRRHV